MLNWNCRQLNILCVDSSTEPWIPKKQTIFIKIVCFLHCNLSFCLYDMPVLQHLFYLFLSQYNVRERKKCCNAGVSLFFRHVIE